MISERTIRDTFLLTVWLKVAHAVVEIISGAALYMVSVAQIVALAHAATVDELLEDPQDRLANYLLQAAQGLSVSTKSFSEFYLVSHGLVNLALAIALLVGKAEAYVASMIALTGFVVYQLYRYSHTHSIALLAFTVLDVIVIALSWHEYWRVRRPRPAD